MGDGRLPAAGPGTLRRTANAGGGGPVQPGVESALSNTASAGLILGGGALGCAVLVVGLTVLAVRRRASEEPVHPEQAARNEPGAHDAYPQQPYSAAEPASHRPYSKPYTVPEQDAAGLRNGHLNGHRTTEDEP